MTRLSATAPASRSGTAASSTASTRTRVRARSASISRAGPPVCCWIRVSSRSSPMRITRWSRRCARGASTTRGRGSSRVCSIARASPFLDRRRPAPRRAPRTGRRSSSACRVIAPSRSRSRSNCCSSSRARIRTIPIRTSRSCARTTRAPPGSTTSRCSRSRASRRGSITRAISFPVISSRRWACLSAISSPNRSRSASRCATTPVRLSIRTSSPSGGGVWRPIGHPRSTGSGGTTRMSRCCGKGCGSDPPRPPSSGHRANGTRVSA